VTERPRLTPELHRERINARLKLAEMRLHRALAERCDAEPDPWLRAQYAERYRELIGIYPHERDTFTEALGRVMDGGGATVQDVIDRMRTQSKRLL
jgi:predicted secreted protein